MKTLLQLGAFLKMNRDETKIYITVLSVLIVATAFCWGTAWVVIPGLLTGLFLRTIYEEFKSWRAFYGAFHPNRRK